VSGYLASLSARHVLGCVIALDFSAIVGGRDGVGGGWRSLFVVMQSKPPIHRAIQNTPNGPLPPEDSSHKLGFYSCLLFKYTSSPTIFWLLGPGNTARLCQHCLNQSTCLTTRTLTSCRNVSNLWPPTQPNIFPALLCSVQLISAHHAQPALLQERWTDSPAPKQSSLATTTQLDRQTAITRIPRTHSARA